MIRKRCEALLKKAGCPCLITSKENVFYFSGFTGDDSFLYISDAGLYLFTDGRFTLQAKEESPDFYVFDHDKFEAFKKVAQGASLIGIEDEKMSVREFGRFSAISKLCPISEKISDIRKIKDSSELFKIRCAEAISEEALCNLLENVRVGMTELDCAFILESFMRKCGASSPSFPTICASGENGAKPHHTATGRQIKKGDLMVIDFGCIYEGYSSDMTRTIGFSHVSGLQKEVYDIVLSAHIKALSKIKSGVLSGDVDKAARDIITEAGFGENFCHSLGHGVGIEVHEMPYARSSGTEILEEGMTLTVEPGIYIPGEFGVRIEDLIIVKNDGAETLNSFPKELLLL